MKKFEPAVGGHRFRLDDLMLMQTAMQEAMSGIISALHPSLSCIMSGAVASVNNSNHNITAGYIAFNGEVFKVDAQSIPFQPLPKRLFLRIEQILLSPSPVTYQDTSVNNVHWNRVMKIKYYDAGTDGDINGVNGIYYDLLGYGGTNQPGMVIEFYPMYPGEENDVFDATGLGIGRLRGWALCNGVDGRPDLRGQFTFMPSVGVRNTQPLLTDTLDGMAHGDKTGKKEINILQTNLPAFNLSVSDPGHEHNALGIRGGDNNDNNNTTRFAGGDKNQGESSFYFLNTDSIQSSTTGITVSSGGGNTPLTNIPPARAMYKIIRITY